MRLAFGKTPPPLHRFSFPPRRCPTPSLSLPPAPSDYEALLALDNDIPTNALRAASESDIDRLPVVSYRAKSEGPQPTCCVCLEQFETGEPLRVLPCFHQFHVLCVDKWLGIRAECPVCKVNIVNVEGGMVL